MRVVVEVGDILEISVPPSQLCYKRKTDLKISYKNIYVQKKSNSLTLFMSRIDGVRLSLGCLESRILSTFQNLQKTFTLMLAGILDPPWRLAGILLFKISELASSL